MSFTCSCGFHYFCPSYIQGGTHLDLSLWVKVHCLACDKKYLYHPDKGFVDFDITRIA